MNIPGGGGTHQTVYPIDFKTASMERVPYFLPFQPAAAIAALQTDTVDQVISAYDFVCTKVGFTSETVGFPAASGRWNVQIRDIGAQKDFQPEGWNVTAAIGANTGVSDSSPIDLPVPWVFLEKTTVRVTFQELTGFANTPSLVLLGFLTNWQREVAAAQSRQEMELAIMQRQMGQQF